MQLAAIRPIPRRAHHPLGNTRRAQPLVDRDGLLPGAAPGRRNSRHGRLGAALNDLWLSMAAGRRPSGGRAWP
jgi:hypothetical protein